jgi:uncharacterized protein HemY
MTLTPKDQHHLLAAEGWLELGDWLAANEELEEIEATCRAHPSVFALRVRIYCAAGKWEIALQIGDVIAKGYPDAELYLAMAISCASLHRVPEASGWLEQALNLNQTPEFRLKALADLRLTEAWKTQA